jgi:hypothetical protein
MPAFDSGHESLEKVENTEINWCVYSIMTGYSRQTVFSLWELSVQLVRKLSYLLSGFTFRSFVFNY